ncbi:hypothetical protein LX36DRAFT_366155 [Colletotrichum falcatum]|nr:hypothetical protein LX36DRAFT_366155 [Colletotrichum falcatum]
MNACALYALAQPTAPLIIERINPSCDDCMMRRAPPARTQPGAGSYPNGRPRKLALASAVPGMPLRDWREKQHRRRRMSFPPPMRGCSRPEPCSWRGTSPPAPSPKALVCFSHRRNTHGEKEGNSKSRRLIDGLAGRAMIVGGTTRGRGGRRPPPRKGSHVRSSHRISGHVETRGIQVWADFLEGYIGIGLSCSSRRLLIRSSRPDGECQ